MSCVYIEFGGKCNLFDEDDLENKPPGCDDEGYCTCDDDPYPDATCENYESDGRDEEEEEENDESD